MTGKMEEYLDLVKTVQGLFEEVLKSANPEDKVLMVEEDCWVTRKEAERLVEISREIQKAKTFEEAKDIVKKEYDNIPYIIGLDSEGSILGRFQEQIESMKD